MRVWAIGVTGLKRMLRDRSNIFFVFILPLAIILLVGAQFGAGGPQTRVAVSHGEGPITTAILEGLEEAGMAVDDVGDEATVVGEVERATASAGLVLPPDLDASINGGDVPEIGFVARPDSPGSLQPILSAVVAEATADHRVARVVASETGQSLDAALVAVRPISAPGVEVVSRATGEALFPADVGQFSVGAPQQLVLFVFLTTLTGSAALIQSRQLGVTERMLSTPTSARTVVLGEGVARLLVGSFQGLYIIGVTLVAFGVDWGDLVGGLGLMIALAATGAGAAMLIGSLFRNDQQAGGFSVMGGLGLAALGGCMLPLELFSPTMTRIAHITPHAWAIDGYAELVYRGGSVGDILGELGVLSLYAVVLLGLAGWRLRRVITAA